MDPRQPGRLSQRADDRGFDDPKATLNRILSLDEQRRGHDSAIAGGASAPQRRLQGDRPGQGEEGREFAEALDGEVAGLKSRDPGGRGRARRPTTTLRDLLAAIPNIPAADVPGRARRRAPTVELRKVGTPNASSRSSRSSISSIGEALGLMDFETAAKLSGARFVVLKGALARLERALAQFMLDLHTSEHGYTEVNSAASRARRHHVRHCATAEVCRRSISGDRKSAYRARRVSSHSRNRSWNSVSQVYRGSAARSEA